MNWKSTKKALEVKDPGRLVTYFQSLLAFAMGHINFCTVVFEILCDTQTDRRRQKQYLFAACEQVINSHFQWHYTVRLFVRLYQGCTELLTSDNGTLSFCNRTVGGAPGHFRSLAAVFDRRQHYSKQVHSAPFDRAHIQRHDYCKSYSMSPIACSILSAATDRAK